MILKEYTIVDAINDNYENVVSSLKNRGIFDEDVFHDTILKCYRVFENREIHKENVCRYFVSSYKMNIIHKSQSNMNKTVKKQEILKEKKENDSYDLQSANRMDYLELKKFFFEKYGKKLTYLLRRYNLGGYSIKELEEESGEKDLRYTFKKMTAAARKAFPDLIIK